MGSKIIEVGNNLPENVAEKVFAKYSEIVDLADNAKNILEDILPNDIVSNSQDGINEIRDSLLVRAKNLLETFYDKKENQNTDKLLKDLERYKAEILLYADTFKKLKQSGKNIGLEEIKNTEITIFSQEEKAKLANELWDITRANREAFITDPQKMMEREIAFRKTIENKNSDFYVLKHKDAIVAFCSITPDENGDLYLESLNTESEAKGTQIGGEFLPSIIQKLQFLNKDIYGHVNAKNPGTLPYYERIGFQVKRVEENGELKYYEIRIPGRRVLEKVA